MNKKIEYVHCINLRAGSNCINSSLDIIGVLNKMMKFWVASHRKEKGNSLTSLGETSQHIPDFLWKLSKVIGESHYNRRSDIADYLAFLIRFSVRFEDPMSSDALFL